MKKIIVFLTIVLLMFSFGVAYAGGSLKIPQQMQENYTASTGTQANFAIWFPVVPQIAQYGWANILVVSNFNGFSVNVQCAFTNYSNEQTLKSYTLPLFGKKIITISDALGTADSIYDIYCVSSDVFGAAVLLLENGKIATAWPPIF